VGWERLGYSGWRGAPGLERCSFRCLISGNIMNWTLHNYPNIVHRDLDYSLCCGCCFRALGWTLARSSTLILWLRFAEQGWGTGGTPSLTRTSMPTRLASSVTSEASTLCMTTAPMLPGSLSHLPNVPPTGTRNKLLGAISSVIINHYKLP
jgi:hypothetical protein